MSADRGHRSWATRTPLPLWFFPALAAWLLVAAATLGNSTSIPVRADVVVALLGAAAIAHGLVQRRWRIAGPLAALAFGVAIAMAVGVLPGLALSDAEGVVYGSGPADAVGVRVIWVAATVIGALVIAWGAWLHVRLQAQLGAARAGAIPAGDRDLFDDDIRQRFGQIDRRVGIIEELLRPESVPPTGQSPGHDRVTEPWSGRA